MNLKHHRSIQSRIEKKSTDGAKFPEYYLKPFIKKIFNKILQVYLIQLFFFLPQIYPVLNAGMEGFYFLVHYHETYINEDIART
jgi:hypothetical protein